MRPLRVPRPAGLYEVTTRITGDELLMRPDERVNAIILGVLAKAQAYADIDIHSFVFMSNHYHILLTANDGQQLSMFMQYLNSNIAKKLNDHLGRKGTFWERRFRALAVSEDEATARWRLRYILTHGVKECLVGRVEDWPGASSLPWMKDAKRLVGIWTDFTARSRARRRKNYVEVPGAFDVELEVRLSPMPCWRDKPERYWRRLVANDVERRVVKLRKAMRVDKRVPMGREAVLSQSPFTRVSSPRRPAPPLLSLDAQWTQRTLEELREVRAAYAEASERFRSGEHAVPFPAGMMRPPSWALPAGSWQMRQGQARLAAQWAAATAKARAKAEAKAKAKAKDVAKAA